MNHNKNNPLEEVRITCAQMLNQLQKKHNEYLANEVLTSATNYATKNLPSPDEQNISFYIEPIIAFYKNFVQDVRLSIKSAIQNTLGNLKIEVSKNSTEDIDKQINDIDTRVINLNTDKSRVTTDYSKKQYALWSWVLYLIAIGEMVFISQSFISLFGDSYLLGLIVGLIVSLSNIFLVKFYVVNELCDNKSNSNVRWASAILIFIFILAVNTSLAILRYKLLISSSGDQTFSPVVSVLIFLAIQFIISGASAYISYNFTPTKSDRKAFEEIDNIEKELINLRKRRDGLLLDKKALLLHLEFDLHFREECKHLERNAILKIEQWCRLSIGEFKRENVLRRSDNCYPECFRQAIELNFIEDQKYFYNHQNDISNEN